MEPVAADRNSNVFRRLQADLRQDPRKAKVLMGLVPLLGVALVPLLLGGYPSKRVTPRPAVAESAAEVGPPVQFDQELRSEMASLIGRLQSASSPRWEGAPSDLPFGEAAGESDPTDPLMPGPGALGQLTAKAEERLAQELMPSATFLSSSSGNLAIIAGDYYREGERIESFEVVSIGLRSLVLRGEHGDYPLEIPTGAGEQP